MDKVSDKLTGWEMVVALDRAKSDPRLRTSAEFANVAREDVRCKGPLRLTLDGCNTALGSDRIMHGRGRSDDWECCRQYLWGKEKLR